MTGGSFGPYRLTGELGRSAMGAVYRAVDPSGRQVALKLVSTEAFPSALGRLRREGALAARLEHPGIVRVLDAVDGRPYVAYQLVEGARTLAAVLARTPPPLEQTLEMLRDVAAALGHAHARGVVHRDVKPHNILIDAEGRPVVADLGISIGQGVERLTLTVVGRVPPTWGGIDADYDDGHFFPAPVGSFPPGASQLGCLDMAGNVWEWTADGWGDYPPPTEPAEVASERASRGGSRDNSSPWCRSTNRGHLRASSKVNYLGLRVAR